MKARKQGFALLLALVMLLSVTSAFASTSVMAPPPVLTTDLPIVTEPVTLSVFAGQQSICEDLNTNYATKWVEEQTGIHIEWITVPANDAQEKLNVMINSGSELPDTMK